MSTIYGTISTAAPPPDSPFLSRIRSGIGTRRSWRVMVTSLSMPESVGAAVQRLRTNASYFHVNYAIVVLFTLFVSLLWHPGALIVFTATMFAWLFLYFLRDTPLVVWGYGVEERVVLVVLSISTVALLLLTQATIFLGGIAAGLAASLAHGVFRRTNDLDFDDEDGGGGAAVGLRETASATYSVL
ncbi:PRA1 family protein F3-like [Salvia miltiorrhiza]|uniref:PRA1 family protein F3-like n=1 Tax=Salvia miltiorrhiza TaxID=226208 RepID=UPI0025ACB20D|nr:PRA1 family protein F3-like [Salvia miltiorrhiza]